MAEIVVIDDDQHLARLLVTRLERLGHRAASAHSLADGLTLLRRRSVDVVLLDVQLPDGNGLEHIPQIMNSNGGPEVIIITGQGDADGAEKAVISGAWSYIEKPYVTGELELQLSRVLEYRREKRKVANVPVLLKRDRIVGTSPVISSCLDQVARCVASDVTVLITGPTGTGKELFARAVHENSRRAGGNFVVVDCAALPETLIEATLFGHIKGAFTSADSGADGLVKHAHGGTLFLDEVGELPLASQKTFLRLLQEHEYRPVGAADARYSDFRVVAATNRNLKRRVEEGRFRDDLLFRLEAFCLELPPLKQRMEDIPDLVLHFITSLCRRYRMEIKGVADDFIEPLLAYDWPGNVRELYQTMEQVITNPLLGPTCFGMHLPDKFRVHYARSGLRRRGNVSLSGTAAEETDGAGGMSLVLGDSSGDSLRLGTWSEYRQQSELDYLRRLRAVAGGNVTEAARIAGLSRTRLYQLLNKHNFSLN